MAKSTGDFEFPPIDPTGEADPNVYKANPAVDPNSGDQGPAFDEAALRALYAPPPVPAMPAMTPLDYGLIPGGVPYGQPGQGPSGTFGGLQSAAPQTAGAGGAWGSPTAGASAWGSLPTPTTYPGPGGSFNPRDPGQWGAFRNTAAGATHGINNMPFVFGGSNATYGSLNGMSPADVFAKFYSGGGLPGSAATPGASPAAGGAPPPGGALDPFLAAEFGGLGGLGGLLGGTGTQDFSGVRSGVNTGQDYSGIKGAGISTPANYDQGMTPLWWRQQQGFAP